MKTASIPSIEIPPYMKITDELVTLPSFLKSRLSSLDGLIAINDLVARVFMTYIEDYNPYGPIVPAERRYPNVEAAMGCKCLLHFCGNVALAIIKDPECDQIVYPVGFLSNMFESSTCGADGLVNEVFKTFIEQQKPSLADMETLDGFIADMKYILDQFPGIFRAI